MKAWRTAVLAVALGASTIGCAGVLGVEFDDAKLDEARLLTKAEHTCNQSERTCNGRCVRVDDPVFGCESDSCAPCDVPRATARCALGACAVLACDQGRADCDGLASNGCEAMLSSLSSCGACGVRCAVGDVCTSAGCASQCPAGATRCGDSCVDITSDADHCGACGAACSLQAGAKQTCESGRCVSACAEGFGHCKGDMETCERLDRFFVDVDGDGWGAGEKKACALGPGLSRLAGDCNDKDVRVHPGQLTRFGTPYMTTSLDGAPTTSYDYDCDGAESRDPARPVLPDGNCSPAGETVGVSTTLSPRSGPGVDRACGISPELQCRYESGKCTCTPTAVTDPVGCR